MPFCHMSSAIWSVCEDCMWTATTAQLFAVRGMCCCTQPEPAVPSKTSVDHLYELSRLCARTCRCRLADVQCITEADAQGNAIFVRQQETSGAPQSTLGPHRTHGSFNSSYLPGPGVHGALATIGHLDSFWAGLHVALATAKRLASF